MYIEVTGGGSGGPDAPDSPTSGSGSTGSGSTGSGSDSGGSDGSGSTGSGSTGSGSTGDGGSGSDGGTIGSGAECYQCLDANMNPVGEPVCAPPNPVSCEPTTSPGPDGQDATCWTCTDGETTFNECYTPPASCTTDADCKDGQTCSKPETFCGTDALCPPSDEGYCVGTGGGGDEPPQPTPVPQPL
ncbi:MAG: hypothetical protein H7269_08085 [Cellulomonas sp.]|nr:hypothetical protein [Cellulomonas sp.]